MSADYWLTDPISSETVGDWNCTYNLGGMLRAADFPAWRDLIGMTGEQAAPVLRDVLAKLVAEPGRYRRMNPENGWGSYEGAVEFVTSFAIGCAGHPDAVIGAWL